MLKGLFILLTLASFAHAAELINYKDQVKWEMWLQGVEEFNQMKSSANLAQNAVKPLPEELSVPLSKMGL